jgi:hypothetical protein
MLRMSALILVVFLSGCSANWHLKKAIAKDPSILTEGVVIERVTDTITVVTPELQVDTIHEWSVDTVTTYVDRVRIRTKVDTVSRTVFVDVVCPPDTVFIEHTYDRTTIRPIVRSGAPYWVLWLLAAIIVGMVAIILRLPR